MNCDEKNQGNCKTRNERDMDTAEELCLVERPICGRRARRASHRFRHLSHPARRQGSDGIESATLTRAVASLVNSRLVEKFSRCWPLPRVIHARAVRHLPTRTGDVVKEGPHAHCTGFHGQYTGWSEEQR
jgi:hypothetical protein